MNLRFALAAAFVSAVLSATAASAQPNTAQVCLETRKVLAQVELEYQEAELLNWARGEDFYESDEYSDELKEAIRTGRVSLKLDDMAARLYTQAPARNADRLAFQSVLLAKIKGLVSKVRAYTGEQEQLGVPLLNADADEDAPRSPELAAKIAELDLAAERLGGQVNLRKQRLSDLNCDSLPVASTASGGALALVKTQLRQNATNGDCARFNCSVYEYGDDAAAYLIVGDPPDRRLVVWRWEGMPGSLDPEQEFTIRITGVLDFKPPGAEQGANVSAHVAYPEGVQILEQKNAYFYQGASGEGLYRFKVLPGATKVLFVLNGDNGVSSFMRYCYGACQP